MHMNETVTLMLIAYTWNLVMFVSLLRNACFEKILNSTMY